MKNEKTAVPKSKTPEKTNPRASGVLVHPTSFPSPYCLGDLGENAYEFIDFLKSAKQKLWQILPLGPTGFGDSPYQSFSSFAGNPYLISPEILKEQGLLTDGDLANIPAHNPRVVDYGTAIAFKLEILKKAFGNFKKNASPQVRGTVTKFARANKEWIEDYALFATLKEHYKGLEWFKWPEGLKKRDKAAMDAAAKEHAEEIEFHKFMQFEFFRQWGKLKAYAKSAGVKIIGDLPIFVAHDSADVWANAGLFLMDADGTPTSVAGVPPDYFSSTGQLWGNPLYNWEEHKKTNYGWWLSRLQSVLNVVDIVRIDHFRGFESYWAVPYGEETAIKGKWVKGPGKAFFAAIKNGLGELPIIAEDLGEIDEKVNSLRRGVGFPGMRVLQFAFGPGGESTHLPHNYEDQNTVVYTGTHDNNTTRGWYSEAPELERDYLRRYMNVSGDDIAWDLIRLAFSTTANTAIVPIQDLMDLESSDRMNSPGLSDGWWRFRYTKEMLGAALSSRLRYLTELFNRI